MRVWMLGYQGRRLPEVVEVLRTQGVRQVLDVRERAWSRKPDFSEEALRDGLRSRGIAYVHFPELGCSLETRERFRGEGSVEAFRLEYRKHLAQQEEGYQALVAAAGREPSAVLCLERRTEDCHRFLLRERLRSEGWEVVDL